MTTILGIQHDNGFVIASDSQITYDERSFYHQDVQKVVNVSNHYVFGGAGTSALVDVVQSDISLPDPSGINGPNLYRFLVGRVVPEIRKLHSDCGYTPKENDEFEFLIGVNRKLFLMASDYSIIRSQDGIYGLGTGAGYAVGAYSAGASLHQAMKIAFKYDINTGGKIQIVKRGVLNA